MTLTTDKIEQVRKRLEELPAAEKSKRQLTKRAMVAELFKQLELAKERGYTLKEIAELLERDGIKMHPGMLGAYLREEARERAAKTGKKRSEKSAEVTPVASDEKNAGEKIEKRTPENTGAHAKKDRQKEIGKATASQQVKRSGQDGTKDSNRSAEPVPKTSGGFILRRDSNDI